MNHNPARETEQTTDPLLDPSEGAVIEAGLTDPAGENAPRESDRIEQLLRETARIDAQPMLGFLAATRQPEIDPVADSVAEPVAEIEPKSEATASETAADESGSPVEKPEAPDTTLASTAMIDSEASAPTNAEPTNTEPTNTEPNNTELTNTEPTEMSAPIENRTASKFVPMARDRAEFAAAAGVTLPPATATAEPFPGARSLFVPLANSEKSGEPVAASSATASTNETSNNETSNNTASTDEPVTDESLFDVALPAAALLPSVINSATSVSAMPQRLISRSTTGSTPTEGIDWSGNGPVEPAKDRRSNTDRRANPPVAQDATVTTQPAVPTVAAHTDELTTALTTASHATSSAGTNTETDATTDTIETNVSSELTAHVATSSPFGKRSAETDTPKAEENGSGKRGKTPKPPKEPKAPKASKAGKTTNASSTNAVPTDDESKKSGSGLRRAATFVALAAGIAGLALIGRSVLNTKPAPVQPSIVTQTSINATPAGTIELEPPTDGLVASTIPPLTAAPTTLAVTIPETLPVSPEEILNGPVVFDEPLIEETIPGELPLVSGDPADAPTLIDPSVKVPTTSDSPTVFDEPIPAEPVATTLPATTLPATTRVATTRVVTTQAATTQAATTRVGPKTVPATTNAVTPVEFE